MLVVPGITVVLVVLVVVEKVVRYVWVDLVRGRLLLLLLVGRISAREQHPLTTTTTSRRRRRRRVSTTDVVVGSGGDDDDDETRALLSLHDAGGGGGGEDDEEHESVFDGNEDEDDAHNDSQRREEEERISTLLVIGGVRGIGEIRSQGGQPWSDVQERKRNNRINDDDESNRNEDEKKEKKETRKKEKEKAEKAEMVGEQFKGGIVWKAIYLWMYSLYLLYFELANRSLAVFNCQEEAFTGRFYMQSLPWLQCNNGEEDEEHSEWATLRTMAIVSTAVYVAGIPLFFGSLLVAYRKRLAEAKVRYALGHLYYCYRADSSWRGWLWLYEMAIIARRLALAILISVVPRESPYRSAGIVTVLVVALAGQRWLKPFLKSEDNRLEEVAIMTVLVTFVVQSLWCNLSLVNVVTSYQMSMVVDNGGGAAADLIVVDGEGDVVVVVVLALVVNGLVLVVLVGFLVWPLVKLIWRRLVVKHHHHDHHDHRACGCGGGGGCFGMMRRRRMMTRMPQHLTINHQEQQ